MSSPAADGFQDGPKGSKRTAAVVQYEMLADHPNEFDSSDVIFESWFRRQDLPADLSSEASRAPRVVLFQAASMSTCLTISQDLRLWFVV